MLQIISQYVQKNTDPVYGRKGHQPQIVGSLALQGSVEETVVGLVVAHGKRTPHLLT